MWTYRVQVFEARLIIGPKVAALRKPTLSGAQADFNSRRRRKTAIPQKTKGMDEWLDRLLESTSANCFVTYWRIRIMLVVEGQILAQKINALVAGSPNPYPSYDLVWSGEPKDNE
ncbi:hypothetical protein [Mesorhizobium sp. NFR06]|uniref:hypothetical protein n=1 Tax=Mesorhizobium sp. NFR06 TaxID=1566290 RepID=UPI00122DBFAF|nr:hypothetical protein [Mesorhizobium sp. NFR06]